MFICTLWELLQHSGNDGYVGLQSLVEDNSTQSQMDRPQNMTVNVSVKNAKCFGLCSELVAEQLGDGLTKSRKQMPMIEKAMDDLRP